MLYGALEAGGTKMVCAICDEKGNIINESIIPTDTPGETIPKLIEFFKKEEIAALGIACFGPICLNRNSEKYGYITSTPKLAWRDYNIVGAFREALQIPIGFDTDVNGSLLGEVTFGSAKGLTDVVYITIGTGIGAGIMSGGKLIHGMQHPEAGHILIERESTDTYAGRCPYHKNMCFEGLASGPAIKERFGQDAALLTDNAAVWELESAYISKAIVNLIMTLSPQKFILGGGVMHQTRLFPLIRKKVSERINGYIDAPELSDMENYITPASLNDKQGILGALRIGMDEVI